MVLCNKEFCEDVKKEMEWFFEQNYMEDSFNIMVWEASKAFFRGLAIRHAIGRKEGIKI